MNQFFSVKVFFSLDSCSTMPKDQFPTWCGFHTIERFEKFKMADGGHIETDFEYILVLELSTMLYNTSNYNYFDV